MEQVCLSLGQQVTKVWLVALRLNRVNLSSRFTHAVNLFILLLWIPGEWVLVLASAGGVGIAAVQIAKGEAPTQLVTR
jgi:NADPH:quinone reductase-like Zn-dependent oxidoreductase